jgi:erythromycin esterase
MLSNPSVAVGVTFGVLLNGRGTVRIDDLAFDVVDTNVPLTGTNARTPTTSDSASITNSSLRNPATPSNLDFEGRDAPSIADAATVAWLNTNSRPFTTDAPSSGFDDLAEMGAIVGSARVVALGEATHGTREFFRMKHRTFEYLVERQGFTHFTIEATMPESRAMDRFVTLGEGDPERLLSNLNFWTWNTQEVLDLVRWMRAYNVRVGAPRLRFIGFDMQYPHQAVDSVFSTLTRLDAALGQRARNTVSCLSAARNATSGQYQTAGYLGATSPAMRQACADSLTALATTVAARRPQWAASNSAEELDWVEQYVTLVRQWERMAAASNGSLERDRAMADNLLWIADKNPSAKIFAWAHNYHVSRKPGAMGESVGRRLGAQYRAIGFSFGLGRLNAVGLNASGAPTGLQQHTVDAIDPSSLEAAFAATTQPRLLFDARRIASGGAAAATLSAALRMRSIGSAYSAANASAFFDRTLIPLDYDALIWFANTTPSVLLPFR